MTDSETRHGVAEYTAKPGRAGLALCLSGGGYRAALFHLGALRRLNELGILSSVNTVSSVSGGSILAAHLATRLPQWPAPGKTIHDWDTRVAEPFREFTRKNIRTGPVLRRLLPYNWFRSHTGVSELEKKYRKYLTDLRFSNFPQRPRYALCATDIVFGVNWVFDTGDGASAGDHQAGYVQPIPDWPLARAVAASSCFPPIFNPQPARIRPDQLKDGMYHGKDRDELVKSIRLSDGGVYDNLGLEPVWKDHKVVLVSDGGAVFEGERTKGLFWKLNRYTSIVSNQTCALRKRWLISNFISGEMAGAYWGIGTDGTNYELPGSFYPDELVNKFIATIRTDLDAFSGAEQAVLENHGYVLTDAAIRRHAPELIATNAPAEIPHPQWMDPDRVIEFLTGSDKRKILGRRH